jgi:transcriptional regulator with XRE-family HTH domain
MNIIFDNELLKKDVKTKRIIETHISLADCSKKIGISKPTLSRIEKGNVIPDLLTFFKVTNWLGTDPKNYINFP